MNSRALRIIPKVTTQEVSITLPKLQDSFAFIIEWRFLTYQCHVKGTFFVNSSHQYSSNKNFIPLSHGSELFPDWLKIARVCVKPTITPRIISFIQYVVGSNTSLAKGELK